MSSEDKHEDMNILKQSYDKPEENTGTGLKDLKKINDELQERVEGNKTIGMELSESEERYRTVIDNCNDGIAILRDGRHLFVNKRYLEIYGYDSIEDIKKVGVYDLIHPEDKQLVYDMSHARVRGELEGESYEHRCLYKDGNTIYVEVSVARIVYENEPAGLAFIRDITDRKIIEMELRKARDELESRVEERTRELAKYRDHLEQMVEERTAEIKILQEELIKKERLAVLGKLTATIAHEIRNPLGTVNTSIYSVRPAINKNNPERVEQLLKLAERNIQRCNNIITDLLDFTRTVALDRKPVKIDEWLDELLNEQSIPEGINCLRDLHCAMVISIDEEKLRRAVINIITNATQALSDKYNTRKEVMIKTLESNKNLEIHISDTGPGISKEVYEKIFEPLFSTKNFGVGLGLCVAKEIIEKHDGEIDITSRLGEGTTAVIRIPV